MQGRIIKGVGGLYSVSVSNADIYECKALGIFRKNGVTPLVGDIVELDQADEAKKTAVICKILPRKCELIRPACANVDQVLIIFAVTEPDPNLNLLDRFLIMMKKQKVPVTICFNKADIADKASVKRLAECYEASGISVRFASVLKEDGIDEIRNVLKGKLTILAGPSGVGKSSLMNLLAPDANMETGMLSEKIKRGKQTTRHTELIRIGEDTYLCDSPGFTSLYLENIETEDLKKYYGEFVEYAERCRFMTCNHLNEPDCAVKTAVENGEISRTRYENYKLLYEELKRMNSRWK